MTSLFLALLLSRHSNGAIDVLANVRQAIGFSSTAKSWPATVLTGKAEFHGVAQGYSMRFEPGGRFCQAITGKLGQTLGYDGKNYWQVDYTGATRRLDFEDVDRAKALMLVLTDDWLDPSASIQTSVESQSPTNGSIVILVKFPATGFNETIHIDATTWLPTGAEYEVASSKTTIKLSNWRRAGRVKVPFAADITENGLTDSFRVEKTVAGIAVDDPAFTMPRAALTDFTYDQSSPTAIGTKRAVTGHVLVHPMVNGKDIGWFILDSGAECMIIDAGSADSLSLPKVGKESVMGVGGAVQEPFRTATEFSLGPAKMRNVTFLELDLHDLSGVFKVRLAGIVGFDFFRRFIVGIDLKKPSVTVNDANAFRLPSGEWSTLKFSTGNPAVEASFEGDHKAWFRLDTGANGTVTFHAPTVEKFHLLQGRETSAGGMAGVGGVSEARIGQLAWFELGGHRFEKISATFSQAKIGAFADRYLAGNIGQDLMEPFTVMFDFGGSRVALLPH